jgi:endoribonuclease LACTB2
MEVSEGLWRLPLRSVTLPPFDHSNSYLVVSGGKAVLIDAGAGDQAALAVVEEGLHRAGVAGLGAILLTHSHPDHSSGAAAIKAAFGDPPLLLHRLEAGRLPQGEALEPGPFPLGALRIEVLHTPGHSPGHLSFYLPALKIALVGDVLAGEGTTWVGVPEGNMMAYLASLDRLAALDLELIGPGHGPMIEHPRAKIAEVKAHRLAREAQVLSLLAQEPQTVAALLERIYLSLPHESLHALAKKTLLAHLEKLLDEGRVKREDAGRYALSRNE